MEHADNIESIPRQSLSDQYEILSDGSEKKLQGEVRAGRADSQASSSSYEVVPVPKEKTPRRGRVDSAVSTSSYEVLSDSSQEPQKRTTVNVADLSLSDEPSDSDPHDAILRKRIDQTPSQSEGEQHYDAETEESEANTQAKIEPASPSLSSDEPHHEVPLIDKDNRPRTPSLSGSEPEEVILKNLNDLYSKTNIQELSPNISGRRLSVEYDLIEQPGAKKPSSISSGNEQDEIGSTSSDDVELKGHKEKLKACFEIFYKKISNPDNEYVKKNGFVCNFFFSRLVLDSQDRRSLQLQEILGNIGVIEDRVALVKLSTELLNKKTREERYICLMQKLTHNDEIVSNLDSVIQDKETHEKVKVLQIQREKRIKRVLSDDESYDFLSDNSDHNRTSSLSVSEASDVDSTVSEKSEIKEYKETLKQCFAIFYNKLKDDNSNAHAYRTVCDFFFKICGLPNHHKRSQELQLILEQLSNEDDRKILLDFSIELRTKKTRNHRYEYLIKRLSTDENIIGAIDRAIKDERIQALVQKAQAEENEKWLKLAPMVLERPDSPDSPLTLESEMLVVGQFNEAIPALEIEHERERANEVEQLILQQRIVGELHQKREKASESPITTRTDTEELIARNIALIRKAERAEREKRELSSEAEREKRELTRKLESAEQENQRLMKLVQEQAELLRKQASVQPQTVSMHIDSNPSPASNSDPNELLRQKLVVAIEMSSKHEPFVMMDEKAENELVKSMQKAWEATKAEDAAKKAEEAKKAQAEAAARAHEDAIARKAGLEAKLRGFAAAGRTLGTIGGRPSR